MVRWKMYWIALISALFGVVLWKNYRLYNEKTRRFKLTKTLIEVPALILSAAYLPALLVVYGSMWVANKFKRPAIKTLIGFAVGTVLMIMGGYFLEGLVIVGVIGIELLSHDVLEIYDQRRVKRIAA